MRVARKGKRGRGSAPQVRRRIMLLVVVAPLSALVLSYPLWERGAPPEAAAERRDVATPTPARDSLLPEAARRMIERAIDDCHRDPTAHRFITLGLMYHGNGLTRLARECYEIALDLGADDARTPYLLGLILLEEGLHREASEGFRRSIAIRDDYPLAHHHLGRSLLHLGDVLIEDAVVAMTRAVQLDPADPAFFIGLGKALRLAGRLDEAEKALRYALRLEPENAAAHQLIGLVLRARGVHEEAAEHLARLRSYNASVYNDPWLAEAYKYAVSPDVRISWAKDLLRFGRVASAIADLHTLAIAHPEHPGVFRALGEAHLQAGNDQQALDAFSKVAQLDQRDAGARSAMAQILLTHGLFDEAETIALRALEINPATTDALAVRGVVALRLGRPDEAVVMLQRVLDRRPDHASGLLFLGEALNATGEHERASNVLRRAASNPEVDQAHVHLQLGIALARSGSFDEAEEALAFAASIHPDSKAIQAEMAAIQRSRPQ